MRRLATLVLAATLLSGSISLTPVANAQEPAADLPLPNGRWYTQASGVDGRSAGFTVVDDSKAPFWREFQRLGGTQVAGYPISRRFNYAGFETQAFQKLVFQWKPVENRLDFVNVFDVLGDAGRDDWLMTTKQVPNRGTFNEEGKSLDENQKNRLALLDKNPSIKAAFLGVQSDPIAMNGLPTAEIADFPTVQVLRAQRVVYQYWKEAVPWAAARSVTVANGGDVAKEAGLYPADAIKPMSLLEATAPEGSTPSSGSTTPPGPSVSAQPVTPGVAPIGSTQPSAPAAPAAPGAFVVREGEPLRVEASGSTIRPKPGVPTKITVRVTDLAGRPIPGALILTLVHYPLKGDDSTYATDGIFFSKERTNVDGTVEANFTVDIMVPSGLSITLDISAVYPPSGGTVSVPMVVG